MAGLNETPQANRIHIAFFGLRNAGKSTLVNALTGQSLAIVSDTPGTTTDPVSKAMEILPLGPCLVTDTAGLDDSGSLGERRVAKSLAVLATTDVAVWVCGEGESADARTRCPQRAAFDAECAARHVTVLEYRRGDSVEELKKKIAALKLADDAPGLLDGLVSAGDTVVCVCPIDAAAPKGRLILPQVQLLRAALDLHAAALVCQVGELAACLKRLGASGSDRRVLVVTDSQAFASVKAIVCPFPVRLTSFSVLFARQKGDLAVFRRGLAALRDLRDGATVLVAEGCTHHRQCGDIGTVKIPKALRKLTGRDFNFVFASGGDFKLQSPTGKPSPSLVIHCGGCMLTRRAVMARIAAAEAAGIPVVNYGMLLAAAAGIGADALAGVEEGIREGGDYGAGASPPPHEKVDDKCSFKSRGGGDAAAPSNPDVEVCRGFFARARGLIGRRALPRGKGLLIPRCNCIHTFFMRFAIDATFLDGDGRVVRVVRNVRPWRPFVWGGWRARSVLETAAEEPSCGN